MTHDKTYNKSPRRINHKATKSKTNTGTTALERSAEQTTGWWGGGWFKALYYGGNNQFYSRNLNKNQMPICIIKKSTSSQESLLLHTLWHRLIITLIKKKCNIFALQFSSLSRFTQYFQNKPLSDRIKSKHWQHWLVDCLRSVPWNGYDPWLLLF